MHQQVEEGGWPLRLQPLNLRAVSFSTLLSGSPSSSSYSTSDLDTEPHGSPYQTVHPTIKLGATEPSRKLTPGKPLAQPTGDTQPKTSHLKSNRTSSRGNHQSTGSFFQDRSMTLGNLMGVSSIVELSRRSLRRGKMLSQTLSLETKTKPNPKSKPWCFGFCLCQRENDDVIDVSTNNIVPLGHFLEVERRAAQDHRRGQQSTLVYGADELTLAQPFRDSSNTLFVNGQIMPPPSSSPWSDLDDNERKKSRGFITPCF